MLLGKSVGAQPTIGSSHKAHNGNTTKADIGIQKQYCSPRRAYSTLKRDVEIVRAKPEDAAVLTEIAHVAKRHWGYPERWIETWREILTMRSEFVVSNTAYCASENSTLIGFYVLTNQSDGLHLDHLWILPNAMRRGIGRALFGHAIEKAKEAGHRIILIESDPNAEGFYKRMGARRIRSNMTSIDGQPRELPLLQYHLE